MNESGPLRADGQGGPSPSELGWMLGVLSLIAVALILRLTTLPSTPDSEDSVLFIRGVIRFSVAESRPHWPGYPVYIGIGKVTAAILGDPVRALHLVSSISSALMAWPLASIARA